MTDHTNITNDENSFLPESAEQSTGIFSGFTEVTWAIVGTGFLLGILIGSIFIVGRGGLLACSTSSETTAATVAESAPASTAPSTSNASDLVAEREQLTRELEAEKLRLEVEALRQELAGLQSPTGTDDSAESPSVPASESKRLTTQPVSTVSPGTATLAYWNHLNAIILQEAAMRAAPAGGVTASNAGGFLDTRMQAAEFAMTNIRDLDADGVDAKVLSLGEDLAKWYENGRDVAEQGMHLLTKATTEERQGSPGKQYQAAERALTKQVNEINSDGERVRQAMSQKYGLDFSSLN